MDPHSFDNHLLGNQQPSGMINKTTLFQNNAQSTVYDINRPIVEAKKTLENTGHPNVMGLAELNSFIKQEDGLYCLEFTAAAEDIFRQLSAAKQPAQQNPGHAIDNQVSSTSYTSKTTPPVGHVSAIPPCRICGDKGDGLHYGVITCRSCSQFFQRASGRKMGLRCKYSSKCNVNRSFKAICAACRFKRCIESGMSKNATQKGRYTYEKRTRDTKELQKLELQGWVSNNAYMLSKTERESQLDNIINHLTNTHLTHPSWTQDFFNEIATKEAEYVENKFIKEEIFGPMNPISREEYNQIYRHTKLDVDGRRGMWKSFVLGYVSACKQFAKFMKALPGFSTLPITDQISIVEGMHFHCEMLTTYHLYNKELQIAYLPDEGMMIGTPEMCMFYDDDIRECFVRCIMRLQRLDLTPEEAALVLAYIIVTTAVEVSDEGRQILLSMEEVISDALCRLLYRYHDNYERFLSRVISAILYVQQSATMVDNADLKLIEQFSDVEFPELTREMLSL